MGKHNKVIKKILHGVSYTNIAFDDIRELFFHLGFDERIRGSHHMYRKEGVKEKINIQRSGSKAKPYQVRQIREILLKYHFEGK